MKLTVAGIEHSYGGNRADIISGRSEIYGKTTIDLSFSHKINVHKPVTKRTQIDKFSVETRQDRIEKKLNQMKVKKIVLYDIELKTETIFDNTKELADSIGVTRKRINDATCERRVIKFRYVVWYVEKPLTKEELESVISKRILKKEKPMPVKCYDFEKKKLFVFNNINEIVEEYNVNSLLVTRSLKNTELIYKKLLIFKGEIDNKFILETVKNGRYKK